jgi:hypothetical protein
MRRNPIAVLAALALWAGAARAQDALAPPATAPAAPPPAAPSPTPAVARPAERPPRWGLSVGGGLPEGLAVNAVFRPVSEIRLHAGPAWNYVGWGVQGGVTIVPFQIGVSPILDLEGGRYFAADASFLANGSSGIPVELKPLLKNVSYDYFSAHVGIEIGTRDAFAISILAGLSYVSLTAEGTSSTGGSSGGTTAAVTFTDPNVHGTVPSARVGLQLWF